MNSVNNIFEIALQDLDLSPTMERNARDKYQAISNYLDTQGIESDFSPQGSFLIGTVVKPFREGKEHKYDLDVLCILKQSKESITPENAKLSVGNSIKQSQLYADKLKNEDKHCWTLEYAEVSPGIEFWMDIVPSVNEVQTVKNQIMSSGVQIENCSDTVAITEKNSEYYSWLTSNPIGFGKWFLKISGQHLTESMKFNQRTILSKDLKDFYAKAEDIPEYFYRSNLQRAVQLLKRHRDIYYDRANMPKYKPSSLLLTALIADSVKDTYSLEIVDILKRFIISYRNRTLSIINGDRTENPVDRRENLTKDWTQTHFLTMDKWLKNAEASLINIYDERNLKRNINSDINNRVFREMISDAKPISPTKPWRVKVE